MSQDGRVVGIKSQVTDSVVQALECALESARAGEMSGVFVVGAVGNGTDIYKGGTFSRPRFVFAMEVAKLQMLDDAFVDTTLADEES